MNFEFKHVYDGDYGRPEAMVMQFEAEDWMEVTDKFVNFLQGCGYFVDKEKLGGYLLEDCDLQGELEI
jgi:hypothetical protein